MAATTIHRSVALVASAALLASLTVATVAAPVSAAKPTCAGKTATKVGTAKGEIIRGTSKADVIVARGGHDVILGLGGNDTICGGPGNDRIVGAAGNDLLLGQGGRDKLFGGAGRDRLLGGPANDRMVGGKGNDACFQGAGTGPSLGCERPVAAVPVPVLPPTPTPTPQTLVIAYSDLNGNHLFDTGDVMISEIVDTNGDMKPSAGDTVQMGKYPTTLMPVGLPQFTDWGVKTHSVVSVAGIGSDCINVNPGASQLTWCRTNISTGYKDAYYDDYDGNSKVFDHYDSSKDDEIKMDDLSPSKPASTFALSAPGDGDDKLIDVEFYFPT